VSADQTRQPSPVRSLTIDRIGVDRLPGISGPFELANIAPGINLVVGPNASGKSRTAEAMHGLIWPDHAPDRSAISGDLTVDDRRWRVVVDDRGTHFSREGSDVDPPELSGIPWSQRDRYLLTLHDLLKSDNRPLAEEIQRQSAGGYDLSTARDLAGFPKSSPKPRAKDQAAALLGARSEVGRLRREDKELGNRESGLASIDQGIAEASAARSRTELLKRAMEYVSARERRDGQRAVYDLFPTQLSRMSGAEHEEAVVLGKQRDELLARKREKEAERDDALRLGDENSFGDVVPPPMLVAELRDRLTRIRDLEQAPRDHERRIASRESDIERRATRIGDRLTAVQMTALDEDGLRKLAELTRDYVRLDGKHRAERELREWVGTVEEPTGIDTLTSGIAALTDRLRLAGQDQSQLPSALVRWTLVAAAILIVIQAVILARAVTIELAILAVLALPIAVVAFRRERPGARADVARVEEHYLALGLPEPASWTAPDIGRQLERVVREQAKRMIDQERALRWRGLEGRRIEAEDAANAVAAQSASLRRELGVTVHDSEWDKLRAIADDLRHWRQAGDDLAKARGERSQAVVVLERCLDQLNGDLARLGMAAVGDAVSAAHRVSEVEDRITRAREAAGAAESARLNLQRDLQPQIDNLAGNLARIYERASVEPGDLLELRLLCDRMEEFRHRADELAKAKAAVETTSVALDDDPTLRELSRGEVETELSKEREIAGQYDDLVQRRTETRLQVDSAKQATTLQAAYAAERAATEALEAERDRAYTNAVSWDLAEFLHERTRDLNRPRVFREAQGLFVSFTSGHFALELVDDRTPTFKARDTSTNDVLDLDSLSSGTRVQLLMAVRIAFIETLEHGFRLPLLLDETLSNTDDVRINAIIDATLEISRRGRQIVYFTAQREEIAKWRARLREAGDIVPCEIFDLAAIRGLAAANGASPVVWNPETFEKVTVPAGLDHSAARAFFQVPPLDPWAGHLNGADLWYFFTDVPLLARLRDHGMEAWGPYNAQRERLRATLIPDLDAHHAHAEIRHRALEAALDCWRVGRCRPVDPATLIASGLLTPAIRSAVLERAEEVSWDAAELIASLESRNVPHLGPSKIEGLEEFLVVKRFIDDHDCQPERVIRAHALAAAGGALSEDDVDALLRSLSSASYAL